MVVDPVMKNVPVVTPLAATAASRTWRLATTHVHAWRDVEGRPVARNDCHLTSIQPRTPGKQRTAHEHESTHKRRATDHSDEQRTAGGEQRTTSDEGMAVRAGGTTNGATSDERKLRRMSFGATLQRAATPRVANKPVLPTATTQLTEYPPSSLRRQTGQPLGGRVATWRVLGVTWPRRLG
jgi:hypothetical protein